MVLRDMVAVTINLNERTSKKRIQFQLRPGVLNTRLGLNRDWPETGYSLIGD